MILDTLTNARRYFALHSLFKKGFAALADPKWQRAKPGRYDLGRSGIYLSIAEPEGKGRKKARLEIHRDYVDIQVAVKGADEIGWKALKDCQKLAEPYVPEKDIAFFADTPEAWAPLLPGSFMIFFPEDAHAPLAGKGSMKKIVVKIPVKTRR